MNLKDSLYKPLPDTDPVLHKVGARIRALRRQHNMTQTQLAQRVGIAKQNMNNLEQGRNLPSASVLYRLARALGTRTDDFFVEETEKNPHANYVRDPGGAHPSGRYKANMVRLDSREGVLDAAALRKLDSAVNVFLALEDICGVQKKARIPLKLTPPLTERGLETMVNQVRNLLWIGDAIIFDYLELLENTGLRILFLPLPEGVQSLSCYDGDSENAFIFVAQGCNVERQLFRLIYELGRIYLYNSGVKNIQVAGKDLMDAEHAARRFAALFLMPSESVQATVRQTGIEPDAWNWELLLRLKHRFGVSAEAFLYRLGELDLVKPHVLAQLKAQIHAHYKKTNYGEPDSTKRILIPNGRLGDLLVAADQRTPDSKEIPHLRTVLKQCGIKTE
jgi:transcriptional regulator with XRE-family HTH domain